MADIFVSYTSRDKLWAFWIGQELLRLGHEPHIHDWEISFGGDIAAWMEERHDKADHILCVVSATYLVQPYSSWERRAAQWAEATDRSNFAVPVRIEDCKVPKLLAHINRCDLFGLSENKARVVFAEFMKIAERPKDPQSFPGPAPAIFPGAPSNIPIRVPLHFLGRDQALATIERALQRQTGRVAITALHGLRGVGKTTLAAAYAEQHRAAYRATWWVRAQEEGSIRADLVALGVRLGWVEPEAKEAPALAAVLDRLRHDGAGMLLIFDNAVDADGIRPFLPMQGAARVLITSNAPNWRSLAEPLALDVWPKAVGADYLVARTGRIAERNAAEALSEALGGLPLAHEQAAAYCDDTGIGLAHYHARFGDAPVAFLSDADYAPADYYNRLTVAKTFVLAIEAAAALHPAAEPLIVHAALLAPEPIPLFLFSEAANEFGEDFAAAIRGPGLDKAVAALRRFALVDRESIVDERDPAVTTDTIRLHRLVREVAAARRRGAAREAALSALIEAMAGVYPQKVYDDPKTWPKARQLDGAALALVSPEAHLPKGSERSVSHLLDRLAVYRLAALANFTEARMLLERALTIDQKTFGLEHLDTAIAHNNLAKALHEQGDLPGARWHYERALAIREKVLGPGHLDTGISVGNLAGVIKDQGDLPGARPLFERALAIHERDPGPEHFHTAKSVSNLAEQLEAEGDLTGARLLCERALAIREKVPRPEHPDPEHPDTAISLVILGGLLRAQGDLAGARPLFERALAIREKVLGPEHPDTKDARNHLAALAAQGG